MEKLLELLRSWLEEPEQAKVAQEKPHIEATNRNDRYSKSNT